MPGWSNQKRVEFEGAFYDFLNCCTINSRDHGPICLGEHLYDAQVRFINGVFDGLEADRHSIFVLKSRQLGLSTISRALSVFYLGMHDGMTGALVMDTTTNRQTGRREIAQMIADLPKSLGFPRVKQDNRDELVLTNGTVIRFMAAGVKKSKSSGVLGRSLGLSMAHLSEVCSYENEEGLVAFRESLSDLHPDRLYIYESTARGPNIWQELWDEAKADDEHCVTVFLGWWSKNSQKIDQDDPEYPLYGTDPPNEKEAANIQAVFDKYGHQITPEQLAWIRRKMDPANQANVVDYEERPDNLFRRQEQAWTDEDAFLLTGAVFFAPEDISRTWKTHGSLSYKSHMFVCGGEFVDTKVFKAPNRRMTDFKVWEEPGAAQHVYVVSADVAFGHDEKNDRSAVQVLDCYADGQTQVAEYAWPLITTRQFAWVILSICGWYANEGQNEIYLIIEINGPGASVWDEIQYVRHHLTAGYQLQEVRDRGLSNILRNVRNYMYSRPDSMAAGKNYMWKTSPGAGPSSKVRIMERCRDFVSNGMLHIRSLELLTEMQSVTREGDDIAARGSKKDDRVVALALGVRCWEERVRRGMASLKRTRASEKARRSASIVDQAQLFRDYQLQNFFSIKTKARGAQIAAMRKEAWRARGRRR